MDKLVIIGYGGHAKSVIDCIRATKEYNIVGYTDVEDRHGDLQFLGNDSELYRIHESGVENAFIGIGFMGNNNLRDKLYEHAKHIGFKLPIIIDISATISQDVQIGEGTFVGKKAVINADSYIGKMCIINTASIIEHENKIGDFTHVAVGSVLCGNVEIGSHCFIGANSTVIQGVKIESNAIIGAGSLVLRNVKCDTVNYGTITK